MSISLIKSIYLSISFWFWVKFWFLRSISSQNFVLKVQFLSKIHKKVNGPVMGLPLTGYPLMLKACEWSAVTMINVSSSSVISLAVRMASSMATTSSSALRALFSWWAWSMRPPSTSRKNPCFLFFCRKLMAVRVMSTMPGATSSLTRSISYGTWLSPKRPWK